MAAMTKTYVDRAAQTDLEISSASESPLSDAQSMSESAILSTIVMDDELELPRRLRKPRLGHNVPSTLASVFASRIVSLPETIPPSRIKSTRVVSLAEPKETVTSTSSDSDGSFSNESNLSMDTSHVSTTSSVQSRRSRLSYSTGPRTPSPPCSPESVLIINNDNITSPFFQGPPRLVKDGDGWMSWTDSPPKPIPALHGPSSLPYARCPSGAEGTIVETEDLSRVVWGLNNNSQSTQGSAVQGRKMDAPVKPNHATTRSNAYSLHSEPHRHAFPTHRSRPSIDLNVGLGLVFDDERTSCAPDVHGQSFPRHLENHLSQSPHIFIDSREYPGRTSQVIIPNAPRLSALDIAHQYQLKNRLRDVPLTPPDSTEPQWEQTPHFTQSAFSGDNHFDIHANANAGHYNQSLHFNQLPPIIADESEELRKFVYEQIMSPRSTDIINIAQLQRDFAQRHAPSPAHRAFEPENLFEQQSSGHHHLLPTPEGTPNCNPQLSTPASPEQSIRQPRSVPFARMMQRRLSSVPEEDPEALKNSLQSSVMHNSVNRLTKSTGSRGSEAAYIRKRELAKPPRLQHVHTRGPAEAFGENETGGWGRAGR